MPRRASGAASSGNIFEGLCGVSSSVPMKSTLMGRARGRRRCAGARPPAPRGWRDWASKRQAAEHEHGYARHRRPGKSQPGTVTVSSARTFRGTDITP